MSPNKIRPPTNQLTIQQLPLLHLRKRPMRTFPLKNVEPVRKTRVEKSKA
jgi:hypothetical protein